MPRRHSQLFARIADFQALYAAARRAVKGKRKKPGAASFFANLERELLVLERQLRAGNYRPGRYAAFEVNDPKRRIVSAAPLVVQVISGAGGSGKKMRSDDFRLGLIFVAGLPQIRQLPLECGPCRRSTEPA